MNGDNAEQHRTILRHLNMQPYDRVKANRELQEIIESAEEEATRVTTYNLIERVIDDVFKNVSNFSIDAKSINATFNITSLFRNNETIGYQFHINNSDGGNFTGVYNYTSWNISDNIPVDTCTYSSGNWNIDCSDNCNIASNVDLSNNNIIFTGAGYFDIHSIISNVNQLEISSNCVVSIYTDGEMGIQS